MGFALETFDSALSGLCFIKLWVGGNVFGLVLQHRVDDAGQFVSGSGDSFGFAQFSPHATVERAERAIGVGQGLSGHPKSGRGAVLRFFGGDLDDLAPGFVIVRAEAKPGREVFERGEFAHIRADFRDERLDSKGVDAFDLSEVDAGHLIKIETQVKGGVVLAGLSGGWFEGLLVGVDFGVEGRIVVLKLGVTVGDLLLEEIVGLEGLLESEKVLGFIVAVEGFGDVIR